jgi:hypothetical protein
MTGAVAVSALTLAACLWTAEAWGRTDDTVTNGTRGTRLYQAPVDRAPDVLCGCTEVLKNFA